jgi:hypothetical protein
VIKYLICFVVDFKNNAYAPSQAHLQGTQNPYTKANLAKEPALFLRFRDIPCFVGHSIQFDTTRRRANIQQRGFASAGGDE